jgi:hypothetical protein
MARSCNRRYYYTAAVLWLVWAFLLGGGLIGHVAEDASLSSIETELKAGSSLVLVMSAWLSIAISPPAVRSVAGLIAVGMTLGCLGDASPLLGSSWPDPQRTLGNMLLFGLGHVAYIRACVLLRRWERGKRGAGLWYASVAVWLVIGGVLWYFAAHTGTRHLGLRVPALGYTLLLSATAGATVGYALSNSLFAPVAIGAILFLTSDVLLAVWIFHGIVYRSFDFVWLSYGVGQMLIVFGTSSFIQIVQSRKTRS